MSNQMLSHSTNKNIKTMDEVGFYNTVFTRNDVQRLVPEFKQSGFSHDFTRIPAHHVNQIQRDLSKGTMDGFTDPSVDMSKVLSRATSDQAAPLDQAIRRPLEETLGYDLSRVRVFQGDGSAHAAERLGARAYTLGNRIHLGSEVAGMNPTDHSRLLTHEAIHTVQQGGESVSPHNGLRVSSPSDTAEIEAKTMAHSLNVVGGPSSSRSLTLRDKMRGRRNQQGISRMVKTQVQRDLTGKHPVRGGEFNLNLKTESHAGAKNGMSGTIKFKASKTAPDSTKIRLLQVVRDEDLGTGSDYVWTGGEANRNKMMTTASPGVEPGFFVDHSAAAASQRTKATDPSVSPYYRDYWPNPGSSQDGSKKGETVKEASLWDSPGSSGNRRFSFETVAKAADTGHVYGTVMWGFTISDASKGKVDHERAVGRNVTLLTTDKAIEKFNEFYRNPGTSKAP